MAYPDLDALLELSSDESLLDLEVESQEALRVSAIAAVERFCGQAFTATGTTEEPHEERLDGTGQPTLYLPRRLSALFGVEVNGQPFDPETFNVNKQRNRIAFSPSSMGLSWAARTVAEIEFGHRVKDFSQGESNVEITGIWGWTDDEYNDELGAVTFALVADMEDLASSGAGAGGGGSLAATVESARSLGITSISQGSLSFQLANREPTVSATVQRLLSGQTPGGERLIFPRGAGVAI